MRITLNGTLKEMGMNAPNTDFNVVFRDTAKAGAYAGVVTWSSFPSEAAFAEYWKKTDGSQEVVEKGVTEAEAIALCRKTPLRSLAKVALHESTDPVTGLVDERLLHSGLQTMAIAVGARYHGR